MKSFILNMLNSIKENKIKSSIIFIVLVVIVYYSYKAIFPTPTISRYVLGSVEKGTVVSTVTGSGQVSSLNQLDLKSKNSGTIVRVNVKSGDFVKRGQVLFAIDSTSAQKNVRDAELNLKNAQLSLDKLKIQNSADNINTNSTKVYDEGFASANSSFLDLSTITSGIDNMFNQSNLSENSARSNGTVALNYRQNAIVSYYKAKNALDKNTIDFRNVNRNSSKTEIENIINETYDSTVALSGAIKDAKNFVDFMATDTGKSANYTTFQSTLSGYTNTTDGHLASLLSSVSNIKSSKDTFLNTDLDLQGSILSIEQKQNALQDAKDALNDYNIVAPFDGTISSVSAKVGDISSGVLGTIMTNQKLAVVSFNEVDIARIKLGQKVTLNFDALPDITVAGNVSEIDSIGTVSSGVVNYNVKISFDSTHEAIKPGMSVSASVITVVAVDAVVVPNSALKTKNNNSYVEVFDITPAPATDGLQGVPSAVAPKQVSVKIGISDDTNTEILSGLKEGDNVVMKTITSAAVATTQAPSLLNAVGGNRSGGGATRAMTGR